MMHDSDYNVFTTIVGMTQEETLKMMHVFLQKMYGRKRVKATKSYILTEGNIPIMLIAHMDTVFPTPPVEIYFDKKKNVIWSPDGLGADDRTGIFIIMKLIQQGYRPHICLTTDEEMGGIGASIVSKVYPTAPYKIKYLIQLDRQGISDSVYYDCANEEFEKYITSFGYTTAWGSFSDISILCPQWGIAGVNLSVGYVREHSREETLFLHGTYATISRVEQMLNDANNCDFFKYIPDERTYYYPSYTMYGGWNMDYPGFDDEPVDRNSHKLSCWNCKQTYEENDLIPVMSIQNPLYDHMYCFNCISSDNINWCRKCGDAFEKRKKDQDVCDLCGKYGAK